MAATEPRTSSPTDAISYEDLYARWERGNWRATEIDFSQDKIDWNEKLTEEQRRSALWLYTLFFHGEDSVADNLSPYIDAAPLEEQKYFLTTQQVDEARHSVFFKRFFHEVMGMGDGSTATALAASDRYLTWGWRKVFGRLDEMADELRADRSPRKFAAAITMYHLVVEASLAQPGQHMIERYLEEYDLLPGFREGMRNVALDEQRHIGFGVKVLADMYRANPQETTDAMAGVLRETLPWMAGVAKPPNWDSSYTECFGFSIEDLGEEGARSIEQKLRAVGVPNGELPGVPMQMDIPPRERAARGLTLLRTNFIGPDRPVVRDPQAIEYFFESLSRQADARRVRPGTVLQWDFTDFDPWHLVFDNGATRCVQGRAANPDLTLHVSLEDFVDVSADRADPRRLMLTRRMRPKGSLRLLMKLPKVFG